MAHRSHINSLPSSALAVLALSLLLLSATPPLGARGSPGGVYAYLADFGWLGLEVVGVVGLDASRVLVVGALNGSTVTVLADVSNPYEPPRILEVYPLVGQPTCVSANGYPVERVAVGTDRGEVLLFSVEGGRVTRYLYSLLGSDFYVVKAYPVKAPGGYRVVVLVSEGGPKQTPCTACHVYVFDEEGSGVLRLGPKVGNATAGAEGLLIQEVAPLAVFSYDSIVYEGSRVVVAYVEQGNIVTALLRVSYLLPGGVHVPAAGALVEVVLYNGSLVYPPYGVNADREGLARIPVLMGFMANLTIRDLEGKTVWRYTLNTTAYRGRAEILLPQAILQAQPDTREAGKVYGVPPFLMVRVALLDLSGAPAGYAKVADAAFLLDPRSRGLTYFAAAGATEHHLAYIDVNGYVNLLRVAVSGRVLARRAGATDYVGDAEVVGAVTYPGGDRIVVALSDGRIRVYASTPTGYRLTAIYVVGTGLRKLVSLPHLDGYVHAMVGEGGVQVVRASPYVAPLFRNLTQLYGTVAGYRDADVLPDLSAIYVATEGGVLVIRGVGGAVGEGKAVNLAAVRIDMLYPVTLLLRDDFGPPIRPLAVRIIGVVNRTLIVEANRDSAGLELPMGNYSVVVEPLEGLGTVYEASLASLVVEGPESTLLYIPRVKYNVTVKVVDSPYGVLRGLFTLYVNGTPALSNVAEGASILLPYGTYALQLAPAAGYEGAYSPTSPLTVTVDREQQITFVVPRRVYTLEVVVAEGGTPVSNAVVRVVNIETGLEVFSTLTGEDGKASARLPHGVYRVQVYHRDYVPAELIEALVAQDKRVLVELAPTVATQLFRLAPIIAVLAALAAITYVVIRIRKAITERLAVEEGF